jgi:hypothetical protein
MKTTNLMIGLAAAAALAQVGVGAANAKTTITFNYTTSLLIGNAPTTTISKSAGPGSDTFAVGDTSGTGTTPYSTTLFTFTPTSSGTSPTQKADFDYNITPVVTITYGSSSQAIDLNPVAFGGGGFLDNSKDTVTIGLNKPNTASALIGGELFTVTLTGKGNPGVPGSQGYIDGNITASPAPEPSEVGMIGLCTVGLLGLMVRARRARSVSGLAA